MNDAGAEARLQALLDRAAISELLYSFGAALDSGDWEAYANNYVERGSFEIVGMKRVVGRANLRAAPERDLARYDYLQHFSTNHRIEVDGDEARASHYLIAVHGPDASSPMRHADIGGRYDCRCVRTPEGWRFAEVKLTVLWAAGESFDVEPMD